MDKKKLWIVTIAFAIFSYLFFAYIFPALFSLVPSSVQLEGGQEPARQILRWPFQLAGLVSAVVILLQPVINKYRK